MGLSVSLTAERRTDTAKVKERLRQEHQQRTTWFYCFTGPPMMSGVYEKESAKGLPRLMVEAGLLLWHLQNILG